MRYRIQYATGPCDAPLSQLVERPLEYIDAANNQEAEAHARAQYQQRGANGYTLFAAKGETVLEVWDKWTNA